MKTNTYFIHLLATILFCLFFIQCKNSTSSKEGPSDTSKGNPKIYVVSIKSDPTTSDDCVYPICKEGQCMLDPLYEHPCDAGYVTYQVCVCFENCIDSSDSLSFSGTVKLNEDELGPWNTGNLAFDEGFGTAINISLKDTTQVGNTDTLFFLMDGNPTPIETFYLNFVGIKE